MKIIILIALLLIASCNKVVLLDREISDDQSLRSLSTKLRLKDNVIGTANKAVFSENGNYRIKTSLGDSVKNSTSNDLNFKKGIK